MLGVVTSSDNAIIFNNIVDFSNIRQKACKQWKERSNQKCLTLEIPFTCNKSSNINLFISFMPAKFAHDFSHIHIHENS